MRRKRPDRVEIRAGARSWSLGLEDAEEMKRALLAALEQSAEPPVPPQLFERAEPRIDGDGTLRIGDWLAGVWFGRLALTRRQTGGNAFLYDVAYLEQQPGTGWRVERIAQERIPLR